MLKTMLISKIMEMIFLGRVHKDFVTELWGTEVEEKREREIRSLNT